MCTRQVRQTRERVASKAFSAPVAAFGCERGRLLKFCLTSVSTSARKSLLHFIFRCQVAVELLERILVAESWLWIRHVSPATRPRHEGSGHVYLLGPVCFYNLTQDLFRTLLAKVQYCLFQGRRAFVSLLFVRFNK